MATDTLPLKDGIGKRDFWIGFALSAVLLVASALVETVGGKSLATLSLALAFQASGIVIWFVIAIKRCRSIGQSPYLSLILLVPIVGLLWLILIGVLDEIPTRRDADVDAFAASESEPVSSPAILMAAPAALIMFAICGLIVAEIIARAVDPSAFPAISDFSSWRGYGLAIVALCGCVVALLTSTRGLALALQSPIPRGLLLAIALILPALLAVGFVVGFAKLQALLPTITWQVVDSYALAAGALTVFAVSLVVGRPTLTHTVAAPTLLMILLAIMFSQSIARSALWLMVPNILLACLTLLVWMLSGRTTSTVGLTLGSSLAVLFALLLSTGILTATEASALILVFALATSIVASLVGQGERIRIGIITGVAGVASLLLAVLLASTISIAWQFSGAGRALAETTIVAAFAGNGALSHAAPLLIALLLAAASYITTPLIAVAALAVVPGVLLGLGVQGEIILQAATFGALSGQVLRHSNSSWDYFLAGGILLLGGAAHLLSPIANYLTRLSIG